MTPPPEFTPTITPEQLKELRKELKQSLSKFGETLKRAIDPHATKPYTRSYVSLLENGHVPITQDIETAYWGMVGVLDGQPAAITGAVQITVYGLPGYVPPYVYIPRTVKVRTCKRPGCPVKFIKTHPQQEFHDPECQKLFEKEKRKKRVA